MKIGGTVARLGAFAVVSSLAGILALPTSGQASPVCGAPETWPPGVRYLDKSLVGRLAVTDVKTAPSPTGTLQITATLQNCSDDPLQIEVRTHFVGAGGPPDVTAFTRVFLSQQGIDYYTTLSTKQQMTSYIIEIREGQ